MASQSLYRKWRSQTFGAVVGQEPVIRTLKNALSNSNVAHAYLFTGPRGTGKTSMARLLAKTINCLHPHNGEPCNECQQCREITAGNSFNVIEIDAASNRGIDSIRELREKVMVPPSTGKYKVYILDEAHMLTTEAFNALLKTLEEPPAHAVFVMATTEVHKMLPTVLSRCQRFDFKRFTMRQIIEHLNFVSEQEQVKLEHGAAELLARAAAGGMRDALSLLDQAIAYCGQTISLAQVQVMLGVADPRAIEKFILHIADLDSSAGLHLIHELTEAGADLRQINSQIAEYWRAMMLKKAGANIATILDTSDDEIREITQMCERFALEELTVCARVFAQNELMQKNQGTPQLGLELALLTCIELHRQKQSGHLIPSTVVLQTRPPAPPDASSTTNGTYTTHSQASTRTTSSPPSPIVADYTSLRPIPDEEGEHLPDEKSLPQLEIVQPPELDGAHEGTQPTLTVQEVKERWEYVKRRVKTRKDGGKICAFLNGYTIIGVESAGPLPVVLIKANHQFNYTGLQKEEYRDSIAWAMKVELEQECQVRILPPDSTGRSIRNSSPPTGPNGGDHGPSVPPQQWAPREYPVQEKPPSAPQQQHDQVPPHDSIQHMPGDSAFSYTAMTSKNFSSPLASSVAVREQTPSIASTSEPFTREETSTRQEFLRTKGTHDPVVHKVVELFKAEIKAIRPK